MPLFVSTPRIPFRAYERSDFPNVRPLFPLAHSRFFRRAVRFILRSRLHARVPHCTTAVQSYRFVDEDLPYAADALTYRLKQVDTDGTTALTEPVTVGRTVQELELLGTFPNPARTRATVRFAVPNDVPTDAVTMRLYDVLGRRVRTVAGETETGRHELQLDLGDLSSGVYFFHLQAGS